MRTVRNRFFAALAGMVILLGIIVSGCGKEPAVEEEKKGASVKKQKEEKAEKKEEGVVTLSQEKQKEFGIKTAKTISEEVSIPISATAVIELNADRISKVSPRMSGRIVKVNASQGDRVGPDQPLAYLDSPEIDITWADYRKATSRLELAEKNLKREETLFEKRVSPEKDVLKARQEVKEIEADIMLASEKLRIMGVNISQFDDNEKADGHHPLIPVPSSVGGTVIEKKVSQGEIVSPDKILFVVADLSNLWVVIDILEKDVGSIRSGMAAKVSVTAFPERAFKGKISYTGDIIDEKTRTVKARITVDNSSGLLKPGMFATVSIDSARGSLQKAISVPEEAVFLDGSERYVFVQEGDERFVVRRVSVGPSSGWKIEIKEGLKVGEAVVTKGVFTLKSELKKKTLQAD